MRDRPPTNPHGTPLFPTAQPLRAIRASRSTYGSAIRSACTPRPDSAPAPQRAAKSRASIPSRPAASANARPAAKQSPAPYESSYEPSSGAATNGPPGWAQPPSAPDVVTASRGGGSRSPGRWRSASSLPLPTSASSSTAPRWSDRKLPRGRDEHARAPRVPQRVDVARAEVDGVAARKLVPGQREVVTAGAELGPDHGDGPLARVVEVGEALALRRIDEGRVHFDPTLVELGLGGAAQLVVPEHGEELHRVGELSELDGRDRAPARRLSPRVRRADDLARARHALDRHELHPLHVTHHSRSHESMLTDAAGRALEGSCRPWRSRPSNVSTRSTVQRSFASCAAGSVRNGPRTPTRRRSSARSTRTPGWSTASICARGSSRSRRTSRSTPCGARGPSTRLAEQTANDSRPAYEELAHLTDGLPPKERAAVVLRYGYDLSYDQIAAALGSSEDAARQAASTGVRRLRKRSAT